MPRKSTNSKVVSAHYDISVFINCPFDQAYVRLFRSIVFTVICCGFKARCALEIDDSSQVRIEKIFSIIEQCRYGIHDLVRTELDGTSRLPRFNMPLELGMFLGIKHLGGDLHKKKSCLVLDKEAYRYQKFISDIAGQDIRSHDKKLDKAISRTRDWLRTCSGKTFPGGREIYRQYGRFNKQLPILCRNLRIQPSELTYNDYVNIATEWVRTEVVADWLKVKSL